MTAKRCGLPLIVVLELEGAAARQRLAAIIADSGLLQSSLRGSLNVKSVDGDVACQLR
jgi:hypothetical protein